MGALLDLQGPVHLLGQPWIDGKPAQSCQMLGGAGGVVLLQIGEAEVELAVGILGSCRHRLFQRLDGEVDLASLVLRDAEAHQRIDPPGIVDESPHEIALGLGVVPLAKGVLAFRVVGRAPQGQDGRDQEDQRASHVTCAQSRGKALSALASVTSRVSRRYEASSWL